MAPQQVRLPRPLELTWRRQKTSRQNSRKLPPLFSVNEHKSSTSGSWELLWNRLEKGISLVIQSLNRTWPASSTFWLSFGSSILPVSNMRPDFRMNPTREPHSATLSAEAAGILTWQKLFNKYKNHHVPHPDFCSTDRPPLPATSHRGSSSAT